MSYTKRLQENCLKVHRPGIDAATLVGKQRVVDYVQRTNRAGRLLVTLFCGEIGVGKQHMARYAAAAVGFDKEEENDYQPCSTDPCTRCQQMSSMANTKVEISYAMPFLREAAKPGGSGASGLFAHHSAEAFILAVIDEASDSQQRLLAQGVAEHIRSGSKPVFLTCNDEGQLVPELKRLLAPHRIRVCRPTPEEAVAFLDRRCKAESIEVEAIDLLTKAVQAVGCDPYSLDVLPFTLRNNGHEVLSQESLADVLGIEPPRQQLVASAASRKRRY